MNMFYSRRTLHYLALLFFALRMQGCAPLPQTVPLDREQEVLARQALVEVLGSQSRCPATLDSDVSVAVQGLLGGISLPGYLMAKSPAFLRFEGINPLGITETVLVTDGSHFTFVDIRGRKSYEGLVSSQAFLDYLPQEMQAGAGYYWLTGRFPPGPLKILQVEEDLQDGLWADISYDSGRRFSRLQFSRNPGRIERHLALDHKGRVKADFSYEYPEHHGGEECPQPQRIIVKGGGSTTLTLTVQRFYPEADLTSTDFMVKIPDGFERIVVK